MRLREIAKFLNTEEECPESRRARSVASNQMSDNDYFLAREKCRGRDGWRGGGGKKGGPARSMIPDDRGTR